MARHSPPRSSRRAVGTRHATPNGSSFPSATPVGSRRRARPAVPNRPRRTTRDPVPVVLAVVLLAVGVGSGWVALANRSSSPHSASPTLTTHSAHAAPGSGQASSSATGMASAPTAAASTSHPAGVGHPAPSTSSTLAKPAELTWRSGVFVDAQSAAQVRTWQSWRGRAADVVMGYSDRQSWDQIIDPSWLYENFEGLGAIRAYGVAMLPQDDTSATLAQCAQGSYDQQWQRFGSNLVASGQGNAILRLGWNFSDINSPWAARDPATWKQCWRSIVAAVSQQAPDAVWEWSTRRGESSAGNPMAAYPGDDVVDIVGVDCFDQGPAATSAAGWQQQVHNSSGTGLGDYLAFARKHGKKLSVPGWGVSHLGGGDNAAFITHMTDFFRQNTTQMAYESYHESDGQPSSMRTALRTSSNPQAAAAYLAVYRP